MSEARQTPAERFAAGSEGPATLQRSRSAHMELHDDVAILFVDLVGYTRCVVSRLLPVSCTVRVRPV